jgi:hypothetical protein
MIDPIANSEIVKNALEAYRIFSQEMNLIRLKKFDLIRSIINRMDAERTQSAKNAIKESSYERQ